MTWLRFNLWAFAAVTLAFCIQAGHAGHPLKYKPEQSVEDASHVEAKLEKGRTTYNNLRLQVSSYKHLLELSGAYPFMNISLDWATRVDDLVSRLTADEMIPQLSRGGAGANGPAPAISRLGIGAFQWTSECLHGYSYSGSATSFPQAINLASMFDKSLMSTVAEAIGKEVRAKHADYAKQGNFGDHTGLSCYSPVINIMRHPFWGRSQETYGEDPSLTGQLAQAYVRGLMGQHPRYFRANAVCKHFAAHNGPEDIPNVVDRFSFNAIVPEVDMRMTFLPHFEACVNAGAQGVMCSYNSINGVPSCGNEWLLTQVLRNEWNFTGFVISDEGAVEFSISRHHYFSTAEQCAAGSSQNGLNVELSIPDDGPPILASLTEAYKHGKVDEALLRKRVWPLFYTRMRLGEFDPPELNPYTQYNMSIIQSAEQKNVSLLAAKRSFVLLKWVAQNNVVPIKSLLKTATVIGPFATATDELMGDYTPPFDAANSYTVEQGLRRLLLDPTLLKVIPGCSDVTCTDYDYNEKQKVTQAVYNENNLIVLAVGTGEINEREGTDRTSLALPGGQPQIVNDVLAIAEQSKVSVVVLLFSATAVDVSRAVKSSNVKAIYQCGFAGQETGLAIQHVLTLADDDSNPAGRLPYTWYSDMSQVPDMIDYDMRNKTYRFLASGVVPQYEFGYGLSYSQFKYLQTQTSSNSVKTVQVGKTGDYPQVTVIVTVMNLGPYNGDEVVQVYASWPAEVVKDKQFERVPRLQLVGFERYFVKVKETRTVQLTVDTKWLRLWSSTNGYVIPSGSYTLYIGGKQPQFSLSGNQIALDQGGNIVKQVVNIVALH